MIRNLHGPELRPEHFRALGPVVDVAGIFPMQAFFAMTGIPVTLLARDPGIVDVTIDSRRARVPVRVVDRSSAYWVQHGARQELYCTPAFWAELSEQVPVVRL